MFVRMLHSLGTPQECFQQGATFEVADAIGASWVRGGIASITREPPEWQARFMARLDDGAGRPSLFLPFVGEFGHLVMTHMRLVHFHRASEKVVCCRPGEQVLFPSATSFVTDWTDPVKDADRIATMRSSRFDWTELRARFPGHVPLYHGDLTPSQELIAIEPEIRIPFRPKVRGFKVDVTLGIRHREFCPERNWPHWQRLADALVAHGQTFGVIGHKATSLDLAGQSYHSGDHDTDAAVEMLQTCRLYVGTDTGTSHLASTAGADMLVFRETAGGSRDLTPRMDRVNPGRVQVVAGGWDQPQTVINAVLERLRGTA